MGPVLRMEPSELESILRNNIVSAFLLLKYAGARMVQHGSGSFVGISSASGVQTTPMLAIVLRGQGRSRRPAAHRGRRARRVRRSRQRRPPRPHRDRRDPGLVGNEEVIRRYMENQAIRRVGRPDDIAAAVRYFAGPESSWTTGQCLTVDGGMVLRRFPDLTPIHEARFADDLVKQAQGDVD